MPVRRLSALSTHATRVALMKDGRIGQVGTPPEIAGAKSLADLYGVPVAVAYMEAAGRHVCVPALEQDGRTTA